MIQLADFNLYLIVNALNQQWKQEFLQYFEKWLIRLQLKGNHQWVVFDFEKRHGSLAHSLHHFNARPHDFLQKLRVLVVVLQLLAQHILKAQDSIQLRQNIVLHLVERDDFFRLALYLLKQFEFFHLAYCEQRVVHFFYRHGSDVEFINRVLFFGVFIDLIERSREAKIVFALLPNIGIAAFVVDLYVSSVLLVIHDQI